ncbi:hypothetical protein ABENE_23225 [Asticcacaulis benevestitus DSM 16100 = ATCC BAA-896]|uniref:HTH cro/C1-type domain-containing protein n=3 Tax=Asticcacaulis TaxID=76890 RepID=V4NSB2_9CAUL|nr:hypothetical protein ABENE_23225 [Asticcacaulis benevestitus DSM 16100 = ATCC BAA-896]
MYVCFMIITPAQCRAARGLLNLNQGDLADLSKVSLRTVVNFEGETRGAIPATLEALRRSLEAAGAEFIPENGGGAGVRLRKSKEN